MKALLFLYLAVLLAADLAAADSARTDIPRPLREDCTSDAECKSTPELHSACSHYCLDEKECANAPLCNAFRLDKNVPLPVCARNAPCRKPSRVWCDRGICRSE